MPDRAYVQCEEIQASKAIATGLHPMMAALIETMDTLDKTKKGSWG